MMWEMWEMWSVEWSVKCDVGNLECEVCSVRCAV